MALACSFLCEYDTPKMVTIKSLTIGIINRIIQLLIVIYIVGYVIIYNKGYQEFSTLQSAVTSKVKGVVSTEHLGHVWDVADYVVPPQENGAFFVMTNAIITPNQTQATCAE
uniref:Uncharacterized protein n=1 Tax=Strigamia maritima TaxID=126957 RepID=T1JIG8_STRMM